MTPIDQADIMNSAMTTVRAGQPIWRHKERGSHPTPPSASCNNQNANKVNLAPNIFASPPEECLAPLDSRTRLPPLKSRQILISLVLQTPSPAIAAYWPRVKLTSTVVTTSTGTPFSMVGLYRHCLTASSAAWISSGCP